MILTEKWDEEDDSKSFQDDEDRADGWDNKQDAIKSNREKRREIKTTVETLFSIEDALKTVSFSSTLMQKNKAEVIRWAKTWATKKMIDCARNILMKQVRSALPEDDMSAFKIVTDGINGTRKIAGAFRDIIPMLNAIRADPGAEIGAVREVTEGIKLLWPMIRVLSVKIAISNQQTPKREGDGELKKALDEALTRVHDHVLIDAGLLGKITLFGKTFDAAKEARMVLARQIEVMSTPPTFKHIITKLITSVVKKSKGGQAMSKIPFFDHILKQAIESAQEAITQDGNTNILEEFAAVIRGSSPFDDSAVTSTGVERLKAVQGFGDRINDAIQFLNTASCNNIDLKQSFAKFRAISGRRRLTGTNHRRRRLADRLAALEEKFGSGEF